MAAGDLVLPVSSGSGFATAATIWLERTATNEQQTTVVAVGATSLNASVPNAEPSGSLEIGRTPVHP